MGHNHVKGNLQEFCQLCSLTPAKRRTAGIYYFECGVEAEALGDHVAALAFYRESLRYDPTFMCPWLNMGTIYYMVFRQFRKARRCYRQAVKLDPLYAIAWFDLGRALDEIGAFQESMQCYLRALSLAPKYADAHYNLALVCRQLEEWRMAICHFRTYSKLDPGSPWSSYAGRGIEEMRERDIFLVPRPSKILA